MPLTSVEINPLASEFPPQYPVAKFGLLMNNCPTVPGVSTGCNLSSKIYAAEFSTGIPIGTFKFTKRNFLVLKNHLRSANIVIQWSLLCEKAHVHWVLLVDQYVIHPFFKTPTFNKLLKVKLKLPLETK